ncbi:O-acetylhomoserine aminocarboxypropyltransferase/cysteine synthase family protein, partial [Desulfovibrio sp.]|uniref:O-acetylhomoserine aminocarboxypropyltransferase/cysteine synthase family protein n=1 Tax=Desulfovibrio sp. TaxID=885 RepID=UPI0023C34CBD
VQSTTYVYDSTDQVARLFDLAESGFFYSRIGNPTVDAVERKIAALEGGVGALCTSSGQAAVMLAALNLARAGDHIVSATNVYGGTFNLFNTIFRRFGIETTFVDQDATDADLAAAFRPNTRFVYGETIANPALSVLDIGRFARLAHERGLPLLVDNTFATPILCRPFEFGADVVIHSTTKYMDGHAVQLGGVIVDSGNFDWSAGAFPEFTEPDASYHGLVYAKAFGRAAYIAKARVQLMRDLGCCQSAQGAFYTNLGLETLPLRMQKHSENAETAARWLAGHDKVEWVRYPRLTWDPYAKLAAKYLPRGCSGVVSFSFKGGREAGARFIDALKLISLETHVADIRTSVLHPATSTHRQLSDEQLTAAGITPGTVRLSVGLEAWDDIRADLERGMDAA